MVFFIAAYFLHTKWVFIHPLESTPRFGAFPPQPAPRLAFVCPSFGASFGANALSVQMLDNLDVIVATLSTPKKKPA